MRAATIVLAAVLTMLPRSVAAQELATELRLSVDNDSFNFWQPPRQRSDQNYTHGMRLTLELAGVPPIIDRLCGRDRACGVAVELGQEIYTPTLDSEVYVPGERPYAGWLYLRGDVRSGTARTLRTAGLTVGVTGPPSLGEFAQKTLHRAVESFREPLGWDGQLPTEVSFAGIFSQAVHLPLAGRYVDVVPTVIASAGTLRTSVAAAARLRAGTALPHPWSESRRPVVSAYVFAAVRGEAVARDMFLDGTLFRDSHRTDHRALVGDWEIGAGLSVARLLCEYRVTRRSRQYDASPPSHTFSSITLAWRLPQ